MTTDHIVGALLVLAALVWLAYEYVPRLWDRYVAWCAKGDPRAVAALADYDRAVTTWWHETNPDAAFDATWNEFVHGHREVA